MRGFSDGRVLGILSETAALIRIYPTSSCHNGGKDGKMKG